MKTRMITTLCLAGVALLATTAWQGGCVPDPCPDLHVACPDLECPDGFKVGKDSCAICECADGEPEPVECFSDADCAEGEFCFFDTAVMPMEGETNCLGGDEMNCYLPEAGECRPDEQPEGCAALGEWACIEDPDCQPIYEELPCLMDCAQDDVDCFCAEVGFVGCRDFEHEGCWSDDDCFPGEFCDFYAYAQDRPAGEGEEADPPMMVEAGVCRPIEPECYSDVDCPEGFFCDFGYYYEDALPGDSSGGTAEGAPAADVMWGGFCMPRPEGCAGLDESSCQAANGCEPVFETVCYPCDCVDPDDCECRNEGMCEQWFVECVDVGMGECIDDSDCPNGFCELYDSCTALDCGSPYGVCVFPSCDDGTTPLCDMVPPSCAPGETLVVRDSCFACVDARTCEQTEPDRCADLDEETCTATDGCEGVFEELPCLLYCEEEDPDCSCGTAFAGCVEVEPIEPGVCFSDVDCAAGQVCAFDETACSDGGPAPGGDPEGSGAPVYFCGFCTQA